MSALLVWTVLSTLVETGVPPLGEIKVIWKRVLCAGALAPAYVLIALKSLLLKVNWLVPLREWLKS